MVLVSKVLKWLNDCDEQGIKPWLYDFKKEIYPDYKAGEGVVGLLKVLRGDYQPVDGVILKPDELETLQAIYELLGIPENEEKPDAYAEFLEYYAEVLYDFYFDDSYNDWSHSLTEETEVWLASKGKPERLLLETAGDYLSPDESKRYVEVATAMMNHDEGFIRRIASDLLNHKTDDWFQESNEVWDSSDDLADMLHTIGHAALLREGVRIEAANPIEKARIIERDGELSIMRILLALELYYRNQHVERPYKKPRQLQAWKELFMAVEKL